MGVDARAAKCSLENSSTSQRLLSSPPPSIPLCSHADYESSTFCSDIALLELNASAVHAAPIAGVAGPEEAAALDPGHLLTAAGWGYAAQPG